MRKLQRKKGPRRLLLKNLAKDIILHEQIKTTLEKAKEVRSLVERLIEKGKKRDLAALRYLRKFLPKNAAKKVIEVISPIFLKQQGGYLKILKLGRREGDGAYMALVKFSKSFVEQEIKKEKDNEKGKNGERDKKRNPHS